MIDENHSKTLAASARAGCSIACRVVASARSRILFLLAGLLAASAPAQTFTVLHAFTANQAYPYTNSDGSYPAGGLIVSGNTLYGTADGGGS